MQKRPFLTEYARLFDTPMMPSLWLDTWQPLAQLVVNQQLHADTRLFWFKLGEMSFAIPVSALLLHEVIQGAYAGQAWVISFCPICNSGACFDPVVNEQLHHFAAYGLYEAMMVMGDEETHSYWDHLTGECLHGPLVGYQLKTLGTLQEITVNSLFNQDSSAQIAQFEVTPEQQEEASEAEAWRQNPSWSARLAGMVVHEDTRLPRLTMGLGVWVNDEACFYPFTQLHAEHNVILDKLGGQSVLITTVPDGVQPYALWTDATRVTHQPSEVELNNGAVLRNGRVYTATGELVPLNQPYQSFCRWYGFAFKHPNCRIYGR